MEVKAIQGLSLTTQQSESLKKSKNNSVNNYAQMDNVMSKNAAEAIKNNSMISFGERKKSHTGRNIVAAAALAAMTAGSMQSCKEFEGCIDCGKSPIYVICGCNDSKTDTIRTVIHDTIPGERDTIYVTKIDSVHFDDYPFHIADSLIAHCQNNGFKIDGPIPLSKDNHVVFLASACYNKYDQKLYQTYAVDDRGANTDKMATLITRVTDLYDKNNPRVSYIKSVVTDVPGKGIQFENSTISENQVRSSERKDGNYLPDAFDYRFMQSGKEIHTNLRNGTNRVVILNSKGEEEWRGDFKKGQLNQTFFFNTFARDPETNEIYYDDDGNPEMINYDFEQGKAISKYVTYKEDEPGRYSIDYDF